MGVLPTGKLDILQIRRYAGLNYDDIVADIMRNHNEYRRLRHSLWRAPA